MKQLFLVKPVARFLQDGDEGRSGLKRSLGLFSLVMIGLGMVIGAGIFTVPGLAAARYAGPGIVYSFLIAGFLCLVAGLCYSELVGMIPVSGSAYAYSYATLGEFAAWVIGWDLCLEYGLGAAGTATSVLLMLQMPRETWIRLLAWLYAGFCIYFLHGRRGSRLQAEAGMRYGSRWNDALSLLVHAGSVAAAAQAFIQGWNPVVAILAGVLAVLTAHALVSNLKAQPKSC